jgi:hypothetical protein
MKPNKVLTICFLVVACSVFGQTTTESPYSFFGLGDVNSRAFSSQRSLGGAATAAASPTTVNLINPATLGSIRYTTFAVDFD